MILLGETEAGTAGTQPCRGIARWAHRDDDRQRRRTSFSRCFSIIGSKDPHAWKIPARRAEYSLTENVASPFQAEPEHVQHFIVLSTPLMVKRMLLLWLELEK